MTRQKNVCEVANGGRGGGGLLNAKLVHDFHEIGELNFWKAEICRHVAVSIILLSRNHDE